MGMTDSDLLGPSRRPALAEAMGMHGIIEVWERPGSMSLADFQAIPPGQLQATLGDPAARAENMFTNAYFTALMQHLGGGAAPPQALYLAIGTGTLPSGGVARTDTTLVTESIRKALVSQVAPSGDPVSTVLNFFSPATDATSAITYTEAGLVSAASLGTLITHAAFAYARSANVDLTINYTIPRTAT